MSKLFVESLRRGGLRYGPAAVGHGLVVALLMGLTLIVIQGEAQACSNSEAMLLVKALFSFAAGASVGGLLLTVWALHSIRSEC